ncbi:hypothetical protein H696_04584 [Fonticula alba]|uniref:Phospholipid/glycerol acyltransferase domain-containing protein n=1 Tax=Fonticula alba TaxID=691883 RepID=A0A058Z4H1_FONAL|nr:hypothetical protein H696_04584 [Fonticula alba]KCV69170.1 hypothetical protein H696_04584 [Fonticula alba]|eukprot:XP_009496741.1 hypothetical protein H696_04584 [Fonticula alba]
MRPVLRRTPTSNSLYTDKKKPCFYLCNHRSWADFTLDSLLTAGGTYISRYGVILGVPTPILYSYLAGSIILFNRRPGIDRNWLTNHVKANWDLHPESGIIVYPEGTRNLRNHSLPLKRGLLESAFRLGAPCQVVIAIGKDRLFNEKALTFHPGSQITVHYGPVLDPTPFADPAFEPPMASGDEEKTMERRRLEAWYAHVQQAWDECWDVAQKTDDIDAEFFAKQAKAAPRQSADRDDMPPGGSKPFTGPFYQPITDNLRRWVSPVPARANAWRAVLLGAVGLGYALWFR